MGNNYMDDEFHRNSSKRFLRSQQQKISTSLTVCLPHSQPSQLVEYFLADWMKISFYGANFLHVRGFFALLFFVIQDMKVFGFERKMQFEDTLWGQYFHIR